MNCKPNGITYNRITVTVSVIGKVITVADTVMIVVPAAYAAGPCFTAIYGKIR
ncbi:hypothetical protein SDC9_169463 [bioreactor metagenome]|uniref:Uncharacterized protein n=1 Tax=bioreactor metagenome TaxID=1076179 RepID=A0A645G7W6_9ZZZZ